MNSQTEYVLCKEDPCYIMEKSNGKLKSSFRMAANVDNGHLIRIVFDLNPKEISQLGDHANQDFRNPVKDKKTMEGISKTGHTDFSSYGTVKAIIDLDTKQQLKTVRTVGLIGNGGSRFTVPDKYRNDKDLKEDSTTFSLYPVKIREEIAKEQNLKQNKDVLTFTVGQKETVPSYKSTRPTLSSTSLYNNQWREKKRGIDNLNTYKGRKNSEMGIKTYISKVESRLNMYKSKLSKNEDAMDDIRMCERAIRRLKEKAEKYKDENTNQTVSSAVYSSNFEGIESMLDNIKSYKESGDVVMKNYNDFRLTVYEKEQEGALTPTEGSNLIMKSYIREAMDDFMNEANEVIAMNNDLACVQEFTQETKAKAGIAVRGAILAYGIYILVRNALSIAEAIGRHKELKANREYQQLLKKLKETKQYANDIHTNIVGLRNDIRAQMRELSNYRDSVKDPTFKSVTNSISRTAPTNNGTNMDNDAKSGSRNETSTSTKTVQTLPNPNYNPEKAAELQKKIDKLDKDVDALYEEEAKMYAILDELRVLMKQLKNEAKELKNKDVYDSYSKKIDTILEKLNNIKKTPSK